MNVRIEIHERVPFPLEEDLLKKAAELSLKLNTFQDLKGKDVFVSVAAVDNNEIQKLNKQYRGKNTETDILSFPFQEEKNSMDKQIDLGEIITSVPFIERSAHEDGVSFEREFLFVFSHGILHLVGYDHEPEMFEIQNRVCDGLTSD